MRRKWIFAVGFALCSGGAVAADWGFDEWDTDGDRLVNQHEFSIGMQEDAQPQVEGLDQDDELMTPEAWNDIEMSRDVDFDELDENQDRSLSRDEFTGGMFSILDRDGDGNLSEKELAIGRDRGWLDG